LKALHLLANLVKPDIHCSYLGVCRVILHPPSHARAGTVAGCKQPSNNAHFIR
jgi:hypothetical protein